MERRALARLAARGGVLGHWVSVALHCDLRGSADRGVVLAEQAGSLLVALEGDPRWTAWVPAAGVRSIEAPADPSLSGLSPDDRRRLRAMTRPSTTEPPVRRWGPLERAFGGG